uniref:SCP domain-containing protein n=1 Tax=Strongyloides papillosus TaxID=174720 RepID=A0A0N5BK90_STREA
MEYSDIDTFSGLDDFSNIPGNFNDDLTSYVESVTSCDEFSNQKEIINNNSDGSIGDRHFCMECRERLAYRYVLREKCAEELKEWLVHHNDIIDSWESTHKGNRRYPLNKYEDDFYELELKEKIACGYADRAWEEWKHCFVDNDYREWGIDVPNNFYNEGDPEFVQVFGGDNFRFKENRESIETWITSALKIL